MKIPLKGLVRNTPSGLAQDGELEDVCNVRYKDGAWRTIPERVALFSGETLPYTNIFIHSNAGYKHYLGLKTNGTFEYFAKDDDENVPTLLDAEEITALTTLTVNATFTQIGNVININANGLKYLIWYNGTYTLIDSDFDGVQSSTTVGPVKVDLKVNESEFNPIAYKSRNQRSYSNEDDSLAAAELESVRVEMQGLFAKALSVEKSKGYANGFMTACTAVELYNGSYILHSNPVLLGQSIDYDTRYDKVIAGSLRNYKDYSLIHYQSGAYGICNKRTWDNAPFPLDENDSFELKDANPIFFSRNKQVGASNGDVFGNHPVSGGNSYWTQIADDPSIVGYKEKFRDYNEGEKVKFTFTSGGNSWIEMFQRTSVKFDLVTHPNLVGFLDVTTDGANGLYPVAITRRSGIKFKINSTVQQALKPLIKSISIFITPEVSSYKYTGADIDVKRVGRVHDGDNKYADNYMPIYKTDAEIITELEALKNFYKVHEIPFDQIQAGDWTTIELKDKLGDSLLSLQPLPIDNFSHHTILPEVQFVYNSKLHIANYKTEFSRGWPLGYFKPNQGIGQFPSTGVNDNHTYTYYCVVHIQTASGMSKVVREGTVMGDFPFSPMLTYPDIRAKKIELILKSTFAAYGTIIISTSYNYFDLKEASTGNYAYYISPDMKPIAFALFWQNNGFVAPTEAQRSLTYQNTLKVSEVNNPFIFPAINTYQIGNGDIIGLATNTVALSTGQFGQFPLYVFCSDGIYGLYIGGADINYSSSRPVSREVCNNTHSIKAIDTGVIFTTDKGVMVLVGSEVKELSEPLRGGIFDINKLPPFKQALNHVKLTSLLSEITTEKIHDYIQSAIVGYNYTEREVWFTKIGGSYSYIFSQGVWYKVKQSGSMYIDDYPKQYILEDGKLIDISSEEGTYQQCYLLTRPIKMGDVEFKQVFTAVIRGRMLVEDVHGTPVQKKWAGIHVYGSYDGERWVFLGGNEKNGELNDFGTRVERTDCKYFRIAFYGNMNNESYINYIEVEGKQSILTKKLR